MVFQEEDDNDGDDGDEMGFITVQMPDSTKKYHWLVGVKTAALFCYHCCDSPRSRQNHALNGLDGREE